MAKPVEFKGFNRNLLKPKGMDDLQCSALPVFANGVNCVSCWELSEEEIAELIKTKRIFISLWSGQSQPPVYVTPIEDDIRTAIADHGVWLKQ